MRYGVAGKSVLVVSSLLSLCGGVVNAQTHPFLICKAGEYNDLRAKSTQEPWNTIKAEAQNTYNSVAVSTDGMKIKQLAGSCALLYILDTANQAQYKAKLIQIFNIWPSVSLIDDNWGGVVPTSSGFFMTVLALDVIHDDLTPAELASAESNLQAVYDWFSSSALDSDWPPSAFGVRAVWAAYKNDATALSAAKTDYRTALLVQLSPDGVGLMGPEYAFGRLNGERSAKFGWMHVGEYTGLDTGYYTVPKLQKFYEWLFNAASSPFGSCVTFMDSGHGRTGFPNGGANVFYAPTGLFAAGHFSQRAAALATWRIQKHLPRYPGDVLTYCLASELAPPEQPSSQVWADGGATFHEDRDSTDALMGSMWNVVTAPLHRHHEINALYMSGYGEHLLLNSGYAGYGKSIGDEVYESWDWIHNQAEASNNLLLGGANHSDDQGEGITESLIAPLFNYARGSADKPFSGSAKYFRNFMFVHPMDGQGGYFVSIDDVFTGGASRINLAWHPASASVATVTADQEYLWNVTKRVTSKTTYLSIFLATAPESGVAIKDGALAGWSKSFVGKYIFPEYANGTTDKRSLVTVFYPHDDTHAKPTMSRISGSGWSGAELDHAGGVTDVVIGSEDAALITHGVTSFAGSAALYRNSSTGTDFYFVRNATSFDDGATSRSGFEATAPVQLHMRGLSGVVQCAAETDVTFFNGVITAVAIDGEAVASTPDNGGLTVTVSAGTHDIMLDPSTTCTLIYTAGANGSISGTTTQTVEYGESGSEVTVVASDYYHFVDWSDGSLKNPRVDTNVIVSFSVTANFVSDQLLLVTNAIAANGYIRGGSEADTAQPIDSSTLSLKDSPNENYTRIGLLRLDTSTITNRVAEATLSVSVVNPSGTAGAKTYFYAVPDADDDSWLWTGDSAGTLTWNSVISHGLFTPRTDFYANPGNVVALGNLTLTGTGTDIPFDLTSNTLVSAVNNDTDGIVNIVVAVDLDAILGIRAAGHANAPSLSVVCEVPVIPSNSTYTLIYHAGTNGTISGAASQEVADGESGTAVTAVSNIGYGFADWSDGNIDNPRVDENVTSNLTVTANFVNLYAVWFPAGLPSEDGDLEADPDRDGMNNLVEYALGGNPTNSDKAAVMPAYGLTEDSGTNWFTYIYNRRLDAIARGLAYSVLATDDLVSGAWTNSAIEETASGPLAAGFESVTNRASTTQTNLFIKLQVEITP